MSDDLNLQMIDAAMNGRTAEMDGLLDRGAEVNSGINGWTALHFAACNGHDGCVDSLVKRDANLNAQNNDKTTPLMLAASFGHPSTVQKLLAAGADPTLKDQSGETALDWAKKKGHTECIRWLENPAAARAQAGPARAAAAGMAALSISSSPFFLASAPVSDLGRAKDLVTERGGEYAAGDADDVFNSMALNEKESWKSGWKGKVEMTINILKKYNPGKEITALAIKGGPACDWEASELRNTFCKVHPELKLKNVGDFEGLEMWLDKYHPA